MHDIYPFIEPFWHRVLYRTEINSENVAVSNKIRTNENDQN